MLLNHMKIAIRSLMRSRVFSLINMFGLSLGVAGSLLLYVYVNHELNYDKHVPGYRNVYRVVMQSIRPGREPGLGTGISSLFADAAKDVLPGVESITRISRRLDPMRINNEIFYGRGLAADPSILQTFGIKLKEGNPETALATATSMVVTPTFIETHFPDGDPIGKRVEVQIGSDFYPFEITGITPDPPGASIYEYQFIYNYELPHKLMRESYSPSWGMTWSQCFVRVEPGVQPETIIAEIGELIQRLGVNEDPRVDRFFLLQPLREIHIAMKNPYGFPTEVDGTAILVLSLIALIILIIASINFTTLSIGRSTTRVVEVGMRKVLGASRAPLMVQFWTETGILAIGSIMLGLLLTELAVPTFSKLTDRMLNLHWDLSLFVVLLGIWLVLIFAAGSYPALVMSRFKPIQAFQGKLQTGGRGRLRRILVLLQFSLSICFIGVLLVMDSQLKYVSFIDLGITGEQVIELAVDNSDDTGERIVERLRLELNGDPGVIDISGISTPFDQTWFRFSWLEPTGELYGRYFGNIVMPGAIDVLGLPIIAGRDLQVDNQRDLNGFSIIINEAFAKEMDWTDPIGEVLPGNFKEPVTVVGMIPDFHYASLHDKIQPLMLFHGLDGIMGHEGGVNFSFSTWYSVQTVIIRLAPDQIQRSLRHIEDVWSEVAPDYAFSPTFIDETTQKLYEEDRRWNSIIRYGSVIALVIAALGLLGLSVLEVSQRRKEIGIRKVLGASSLRLVVMLARQMTFLVLGSAVIALPAAYFISSKWLESFAYRVPISPFTLFLALLTAVLVTWLTVGSLAYVAATRNPVDAIRHE